MKNSSPLDPVIAEPARAPEPRVSKMAIASLSLVIVAPVFAVLALILGFPMHPALGLPALLGLLLAHVALFRIRASNGELTGIGFAAAAMAIGYLALLIGIAWFVLLVYVVSQIRVD